MYFHQYKVLRDKLVGKVSYCTIFLPPSIAFSCGGMRGLVDLIDNCVGTKLVQHLLHILPLDLFP